MDRWRCRASRKLHKIGIAQITLVGLNNELSLSDFELNFFDTDKRISVRTFFISSTGCISSALGAVNGYLCYFYPWTLILEELLRVL